MSGVIYLRTAQGLLAMEPRPYALESVLQRLLEEDARLLGGASTGDSAVRRWILIAREAPISAASGRPWWADHIFVDHEGVPTIVEVKQGANTQIRREIVGQLLDYMSNLHTSMTADSMRALHEERATELGQDPELTLRETLGIEMTADEYWAVVAENLAKGRIRGYFVADQIPEELRRVVEYLNRQLGESRFLALEVQQFQTEDGSTTTLVPQVVAGSLIPAVTAGDRELSESEAAHLGYWQAFGAYLDERGRRLPIPKPAPKSLFYLRLPRTGFRLCAWNIVKGSSGVALVINAPDAESSLDVIERDDGARIDQMLSPFGTPEWERRSPEYAQLFVTRQDRPLTDTSSWPSRIEWQAGALVAMYELFG